MDRFESNRSESNRFALPRHEREKALIIGHRAPGCAQDGNMSIRDRFDAIGCDHDTAELHQGGVLLLSAQNTGKNQGNEKQEKVSCQSHAESITAVSNGSRPALV